MNSSVVDDRQLERLTAAAEHLNAAFLQRFATVPDVKPETVIASTARIAGAMLSRSVAPPAKGPRLMDTMFVALRSAGHALTEQDLDKRDTTSAASQLSLEESQALLEATVVSYCESAGLTYEDAAQALAIAAALFIHDCRAMLDVRTGAAIAVYGFVEGRKMAPPPVAEAQAKAAPGELQLEPVTQRSVSTSTLAAPAASAARPSLRKYMLLFGGLYAVLMMLAGLAVSMLGISSGGINTGVFIGVMYFAAIKFVKDHRRLWVPAEKWRLIFGFLLVTLAFDFVLSALASMGKVPLVYLAAATAFIGVLRLFTLWIFFGPFARPLFGRYATSR